MNQHVCFEHNLTGTGGVGKFKVKLCGGCSDPARGHGGEKDVFQGQIFLTLLP